jgi:hypothetical protein
MAVSYPIPPWLKPNNAAEEYAASLRQSQQIKATLAGEQARLQQQATLASMEMQAKQDQNEKRNALEQQQIAQDQAMKEAQIGLKRQELQQHQQTIDLQTQLATRKYAATRAFQSEVGDGTDPQAMMRGLLKYGTEMGAPGAAMSAAMRIAPRATVPPSVEEFGGEKFLKVPGAQGESRYQHIPRQPKESPDIEGRMLRMNRINELERQRDRLEATAEKDNWDMMAERRTDKSTSAATLARIKSAKDGLQRIKDMDAEIKRLQSEGLSRTSGTGTTPAGKEVTRKTKDGRLAVFDADSKKFLRYAGDSDTEHGDD